MNLKESIDAGRKYLVVGQRRSTLCKQRQLLGILSNLSPIWEVYDLGRGWQTLVKLAGPETRSYASHEISIAAGVNLSTVSTWCLDGVIRASIRDPGGRGAGRARVFSFGDLLVATTVGSMRRRGVPPTVVHRMAKYLYEMITEESKDAVGV